MNLKIGTMFTDVLRSFFKKPFTDLYPVERREMPSQFRGKLHWDPEKCTGCSLCSKDCPADAIEIVTIDRKAKRFVMVYHVDRCIYCGQCEEVCRFKCIDMSNEDWELATTTKEPFTVYYGEPEDIDAFLGKVTEDDTT